MEILSVMPITYIAWYGGLIFVITVITALLAIFAACDHERGTAITSFIITVVLFVILVTCPMTQEDKENAIYTVEITDSEQYQKLIEDGYTFERVYDNREIYNIRGPIINE